MGNQSPLRGVRAVLLLADESAHLVLGGLTQINRLLHSVQECCITPPASNTRPLPVMVWWRNAALRAAYQSPGVGDPPLLSVVHWSGDLPPDGGALAGSGLVIPILARRGSRRSSRVRGTWPAWSGASFDRWARAAMDTWRGP